MLREGKAAVDVTPRGLARNQNHDHKVPRKKKKDKVTDIISVYDYDFKPKQYTRE